MFADFNIIAVICAGKKTARGFMFGYTTKMSHLTLASSRVWAVCFSEQDSFVIAAFRNESIFSTTFASPGLYY